MPLRHELYQAIQCDWVVTGVILNPGDPLGRRVAYATLGVGTGLWLDADVVVHSSANTLLASEVSFRRLDGNVSEQKMDLFQFSARGTTELRAGAPQIMWRHL